ARVFERGAGETLSSGTGACGAAVAYVVGGGRERAASVTVVLDGGQLLVEVGDDLHLNLTGWARPVFQGRLSECFASELHETEKRPGGAPAIRVRGAGAQDRRQARGRDRRDQPRHRRSG